MICPTIAALASPPPSSVFPPPPDNPLPTPPAIAVDDMRANADAKEGG
jgi:hypothetical protein